MKLFNGKQKRALIIFDAILLFGLLVSCSNASQAIVTPSVTSIRVVMDNNYPPYIFLDEQGNARGILVDQWALWEKRTGVKVELSAIPWEDALNGMKNGEFDVIDTVFYTEERAKIYDFTASYARIDVPIFFHNNISGIADANDLKGFRVAVKSGDTDAEYLKHAGVTGLVYYNSYEDIIRAAERKEETIFVIDQPPGLYFLYKYGLQSQFNYSAPLFSGEFHRAVMKGNSALLDLVSSGFASISESEYQAIDDRWFGIQQGNSWQEYLPYLQGGIIIAFLAICILIVFNRTLRRRVSLRTQELKQALSSLQKSERMYREIFNATNEAIFIHAAPSGQLLHVNETMLRLYGFASEEEALSQNLGDLSVNEPPYSWMDAQAKMQKALEEGPQVFEWLAKKKTGENFWTEISLRSSEIGGEHQILAVVRDISERKQADAALRKSEERYRSLFDNIMDGIYRSTHAGKFVEVNPAMVKMFGYESREEMLAVDIKKDLYFAPEERGSHILDTGQAEVEAYRMRRKDGSEIWVEDHGYYVHDEQGNILFHDGILRDITNRKQAEAALRESENLIKESQIVADMGSYVLDFSTGMWKSSAILDKLFGIGDAYIRSVEGWTSLIHPDHRQQMTDYFTNEVMGKRIRFDREYKIVRKNDESERWVHGLGELEVDAQNNLLKMHGVIQDITERKQAEQALQTMNILLEQTLEQSPIPMVLVSMPDGIIRSVNSACRHFLGVDDEPSVIGTSLFELKPSWEDLDMQGNPGIFEELPLPRSLIGLKTDPQERRIVRKDGTSVYELVYGSPIFDATGKVIAGYLVMIDITERKRTEQDIHQRVMELEMLYQSGLAINQLLSPREIGQKVIELLEQKLGWHHTRVRLYHPQNESLELLAFNQPGLKNEEERHDVVERFSTLITYSNQGLSGWAVQHKQVIRLSGLSKDPRYVETYPGLQSGLYVPMKLGEHVIGVISIESEQIDAFSAADERLVSTLANQAASALENARLFEAERTQRQVSDALRDALSAGASMSISLDFETILDRLLEALERVVPFEGGSIMIVQQEKQKINIARVRGYKKLEEQLIDKISKFSFDIAATENLRWILANKQPLVIPDTGQYPDWVRALEANMIRSWAGVPIIVNDEVIALFSLDSYEPNYFTNEHIELMRAFAGQASLALQNARLFEQTERRFKEFAALYEISNALSADNDLNTLLKDIVEHAATLLNASVGAMYLYNQADDTLEIVVSTSPAISIGTTLHLGEGMAGRVAQAHKPMRIEDYSTWEGRSRVYDDVFFHAVLEVPMLFGGALIGVLDVAEMNDSSRTYTESDERLLSLFAAQAAGVLHSARLREETARRAREFASLYETSKALSADNDLNTLLKDIVEHATTMLNAKTGAMYLYDRVNENLEVAVSTTPAISIGTTLHLGEGMAGQVAQTRQPMRIEDYSTWEGRLDIYDNFVFRADLEVPMLFGGDLIGVLDVAETGDSSRIFTESDERLLSLFAAQAAGVLHSARLREETARRAREFASLYETSNALSSENELNAMLQVIVEHARNLLGSASSGIYLYLPETGELELTVDTTLYDLYGTRLKLNEGLAGRVAQTRQAIRVDNYSTWEGRSPLYDDTPIRAVLEVPMLYGGELIGVLTADEVADSERKFTEADERLLSLFASQAAGAIHSARLREQTARRLDQLQALHIIDRAISSSFDLRPILNTVISHTISHLGVDAVDVLLYHPHLQTLEYVTGQGFHTSAIEHTHPRLGEGHAGRAALERHTIHIPNLPETGSNFKRAAQLAGEGFLEYYGVPLIAKGEVKGVLEVFNRTLLPRSPEWLDFLETLAGQAAITIDQTQLFENLQHANFELITAYDATIEGWARAMDLRDKETEIHTRRVSELTMTLAVKLGIKNSDLLHIRRGALLHDIGKMGVPDNILLKEGKLTEKEWELMRQHPQFAYEMLQPINYLRESLDIPYCHHEKWDGTGYPRGLKEEQIPLAARIFAIVDVWDAITSERPYRKGWTKQKALKYLREQSGKHFEPRIVNAFLEIFENEKR